MIHDFSWLSRPALDRLHQRMITAVNLQSVRDEAQVNTQA
jgi:hypothetical protein